MKHENFDRHKFRACVDEARKIILEKDDFSLEARNLLAHLIYDNRSIKGINFKKLCWDTILFDYPDWVEYYNMTENRFIKIKEFLIKKIEQNGNR
ncbi:hypothetical protein FPF71_16010 [Algibacter amylolyticus]|uniref:Uncharacterized protein n=1 Tax=Algibacter amylolyticus TaxID=1608400 RepID=A0A5M7AVK0_9FLAO|nr:hypothetical protein [Algibacter amylolyticus]KAA5821382.1 hypothetical protein F2B50_16010 [Algibacter amylolyticus]MBB5268250.1 hypothetical protein [Algibacter amylolyticus]TSJ72894.1 hypothetical protein FPF71_16010 [Algibacter amylolyticus]